MRKFKYILIFLLLTVTAVVIKGGTSAKCEVEKVEASTIINKGVAQGFPDLVSFTNFINQ
jgi:hypothetical protein